MAVTKQSYSTAPTWTAAQIASMFRTAFIDAGLMTDWFDSFTSSGHENRILQIQYDAAKTYGTTYYWFIFHVDHIVSLHVATGWNATTHVPTGTQYLDYFSTATNNYYNHWQLLNTSSSTTLVNLVRYSSGSQHWFVVQQNNNRKCFTIQPASHTLQPWINLDKGYYSGFININAHATDWPKASIDFCSSPALRRHITIGPSLRGVTYNDYYRGHYRSVLQCYQAMNNQNDNGGAMINATWFSNGNSISGARPGGVVLPVGFTAGNPAYTSNSTPVFHSMPMTPYSTTTLNSDFGLTFHYDTNIFGFQDKFIVTSGSEEWEVLEFANASAGDGTSPSAAFLARVV